MIQFFKECVKFFLQVGKVRASLDLRDYFLLNFFDATIQIVEVTADFILHALLKRIWLKVLNFIQVLNEFFILGIDFLFSAFGSCNQEFGPLQSLLEDALVATIN